jgi:predicted XRE-type DNA-binding protein
MEYENTLAKSEIKNLMSKLNLSNRQCASVLGITDKAFANKLSRGSFSLGDYLILLKGFNLYATYIDLNDYD